MTLLDFLLSLLSGRRASYRDADLPAWVRANIGRPGSALFPVLYHELNAQSCPDIPGALKNAYYANVKRATLIEHEARNVLAALAAKNVPCMEIKGQDFERRFYPAFGTRHQTDIDFLVGKNDMPLVKTILPDKGYEFVVSEKDKAAYCRQGFHLDFHTNLFGYMSQVILETGSAVAVPIGPAGLPLPLCLVFACAQYVADIGRRPTPALDIYLMGNEQPGRLLPGYLSGRPCLVPFVLAACHDMMNKTGFSPIDLDGLHLTTAQKRLSRKIGRFMQKPRSAHAVYLWLMFHTGNSFRKLFRLLFPPKEIWQARSYVRSRWDYMKRIVRRVIGLFFS